MTISLMDLNNLNNTPNQSYWFVVREDQNNVILSSNNFTIQNEPLVQAEATRYVVEATERQYNLHINETPIPICIQDSKNFKSLKQNKGNWDKDKVNTLLSLCLQLNVKRCNPSNNKEQAVWSNIAALVNVSPEQCIKKYKSLRSTYLRLAQKKTQGKDVKWVHYSDCENVFKHCSVAASHEIWEDSKIRTLLNSYIDNQNKFQNPNCYHKDIWAEIASQVGTTEFSCYQKFTYLKRTYVKLLDRHHTTGKTIKWPYKQYFEKIYYNYSPIKRPWDRIRTKLLLDAYLELADKFKNPKYQKKDLWKEISSRVGVSPIDCDRKFRNLKQTFIRLKIKQNSGKLVGVWRYYKHFEQIYPSTLNDVLITSSQRDQEENYIKQLLTFCVENREKLTDPLAKKKCLWRTIGPKLGLSSEECNKKFRNLKQTYVRIADKKKRTGKGNKWPYFSFFDQIYNELDNCGVGSRAAQCEGLAEKRLAGQAQGQERKAAAREVQTRRVSADSFTRLVALVSEANDIQRERNKILQALLLQNMTS